MSDENKQDETVPEVLDEDPEILEAELGDIAEPLATELDADLDSPDLSLADSGVSGELVRYDPLQSYLAEIRNSPVLSREEEYELAVRYREKGDRMAGYRLVLANLRLVVAIAREYQRNFQNILDLVQEGNIGLLEAVKQYDPYRGIRFPSYAVYWVRAYMLRYLIANIRLVKIGTTQAQRKLFFNLRKEKDRLEAEGFVPEAKLLAERLNVKEAEVLEMEQRLALPDVSVDAPLSGDEDAPDMHNVLSNDAENLEDRVVREQFSASIREALAEIRDKLDEKERVIIDRRLFADEPATLQDIANEFGVSRERIRQIESRLKDRLKEFLKSRLQLDNSGEVELADVPPGTKTPVRQ